MVSGKAGWDGKGHASASVGKGDGAEESAEEWGLWWRRGKLGRSAETREGATVTGTDVVLQGQRGGEAHRAVRALRGRGQVVREGQVEGSRAGGAGGRPRDGTADPTPSERPHTHPSSGTLPRLCLRGSAAPGLSSPAGAWHTKGVGTQV